MRAASVLNDEEPTGVRMEANIVKMWFEMQRLDRKWV